MSTAGAGCEALKGRGSSTPCFGDIPAVPKAALSAFDEAAASGRGAAARAFSQKAERLRETLPLFHFMRDSNPEVVEAGVDGLIRLAGTPQGYTRAMCIVRSPAAVEAWREYLEEQLGAWW